MYQDIIKNKMPILILVRLTFELLLRNIKKISLVVILFNLPLNAHQVLFKLDEMWVVQNYLLAVFYNLLTGVIMLLPLIAMTVIIDADIRDQDMKLPDAVKIAFQKFGKVIKTNILMFIIICGLFLLLIIPGVIWSVYYIFVLYIVVLRNRELKNALNYSKLLVRGSWWKVFFINIIIIAISAIFQRYTNQYIELPIITILLQTINDLVINSIILIANYLLFINLEYLKVDKINNSSVA